MNTEKNRIQDAINELQRFYWLDGLVAKLSTHHRKFNFPRPPDRSFGRTPRVLPFINPNKISNLYGYEQLAIESYNEGVVFAHKCIDWEYSGLLTAIANEAKGTSEWNAYIVEARASIKEYFESGEAWSDFEAYMIEPVQELMALE
ncbi:MAG: hypothetical protein AAGC78_13160 [Cellvibrio sp.]|uniref:hypothetical protein n=1 Tax=Cellvibrio sp. TaxID=1965322 RepID=UPI0031A22E87